MTSAYKRDAGVSWGVARSEHTLTTAFNVTNCSIYLCHEFSCPWDLVSILPALQISTGKERILGPPITPAGAATVAHSR